MTKNAAKLYRPGGIKTKSKLIIPYNKK